MTIALFPKTNAQESLKVAHTIASFFQEQKVPLVVEDDAADRLGLPPLSSVDPASIKFLIAMGGDGSILRIAHRYVDLEGAILGVNLGHLGFMADVQVCDLRGCLEDLVKGAFTTEERLMLHVHKKERFFFAMNDCVLHRARNPNLIELALYVDDSYSTISKLMASLLPPPMALLPILLQQAAPL